MKRVIYISTFLPRYKKASILNSLKLFDNNAADTLSYAIYEGLSSFRDFEFLTLNVAPVGPFPKCSIKPFYKGESFIDNEREVIDISFSTVFMLQHYSIYKSCCKSLKTILNKETEYEVLLYSINPSILKALISLKKKGYKIKIILLIPDFWDDMLSSNSLKAKIKRLILPDIQRFYNYCDGFILLTEQMNEKINVNRPHCVVEGMYNSNEQRPDPVIKDNAVKVFFYSGMLHEKFGIVQLLRTFHEIKDPDIRLRVCGSGDAENKVREYTQLDNRITYLGLLKREQVLIEQFQADFLVNPRTPEGDFTKYSFPSKTIEYLASGTPTIIHRLPGIPDEYYNNCLTFPSYKDADIIDTLCKAISMSSEEIYALGYKAKKFIETFKTEKAQCKKIIDFMNSI